MKQSLPGALVISCGVLLCAYYLLLFETGVVTGEEWVGPGRKAGDPVFRKVRTSNLDLLNRRQGWVTVGSSLIIAGTILLPRRQN